MLGQWNSDICYIRMQVCEEQYISFAVSEDGEKFRAVGEITSATPGRWVGVKCGLTVLREKEAPGGSVAFDYYVVESNR